MSTSVDMYDIYKFEFTIEEIITLGCDSEEILCMNNRTCTKYTCNYALHFYYDYAQNFGTK